MNLRRYLSLFLVLGLLAASGCSTLFPTRPPAATATSIPRPAPTSTPLPTKTPLPTPTQLPPTPTSGPAHPILAFPNYESPGGYLLGAARDGGWLAAEDAVGLVQPQQAYALYSPLARQGSAVGAAPVAEPTCPSFWSVQVEHSADMVAAVGADWDALPRLPQEVSTKDPEAIQQVHDFLANQGISEPDVNILRILRADLEGDGSDEWLVAASRFVEETGHDVSPGDYSLILLYHAGEAAQPVVSDWYTQAAPLSFPDRFGLSALLDLNGDGLLEILVEITGWEKTGAQVYTVKGAALENVLQARCP